MIPSLELLCNSLDDLANSILNASADNRTMTEWLGWNTPPFSRHDLSNIARNISQRLKENDSAIETEEIKKIAEEITQKVALFKAHTLPQLFNGGNAVSASFVYFSFIEWITNKLNLAFGWEILNDNNALPKQLVSRLRSIEAELTELAPNKQELQNQIKLIQDATEAAISLPTDLASLKEARAKVEKFLTDSAELHGKIDAYYFEAEKNSKLLVDKKEEAEKIVALCEEAYKITTTKGLAAAFDQRAKTLSDRMSLWVVGLLGALSMGIVIGTLRFAVLSKSLQVANPQWSVIWMDIILSLVGLAAPIWFAWVATKQINQLFRLSEDYAFKASVAKAYEGYRREAARIDESFEARLFSSALTRLEEAPLRLVETEYHASPWQELFSSAAFQNALDTIPGLKEKFVGLTQNGIALLKNKARSQVVIEEAS